MALSKDKLTIVGVLASYWRLGNIEINRSSRFARLKFGLFYDSSVNIPLETRSVLIDTVLYDKYFKDEKAKYDNIYQACYMCAKETDEFFADAEDC